MVILLSSTYPFYSGRDPAGIGKGIGAKANIVETAQFAGAPKLIELSKDAKVFTF